MKRYKNLKNWHIEKDYLYGTDNKKYQVISMLLNLQKADDGFIAETMDGMFFLPLINMTEGETASEDFIEELERQQNIIDHAAEKLLSEGDCMLCDNVLRYYSEKGIVLLHPERMEGHWHGFKYSYPDEDFEFIVEDQVFFTVRCRSKYQDGCLYNVNADSLRRYDYKCIDFRNFRRY